MKRAIHALAPLGIVVAVGAIVASRQGLNLPGGLRAWLIGGAVLVLAHVLLRWEDIAAAVGARRLRYGGNALVYTLVVLGILVTLNWLARENPKRWDLTENRRFSLSDQSEKVLQGLDEDIRILYFQRTAEIRGGQDRMKQYEAASRHVKVEFIDPLASPTKAREYEARPPYPVIVVERGERRERVTSDAEQDLTNALVKVTRDGTKTVCFVEGQGERDPDDSGETGFSAVKAALEKSQYAVKKAFLMREGQVPSDCTVLVVAGPEKDLLPSAVQPIREFVKGGGTLLAMVEPENEQAYPNLEALLKEWNIDAGRNVVLDVSFQSQLAGTGPIMPLAARYPFHEITRNFRPATAFMTVRSMEAGKESVEGVVAQNLVETSEDSWAESDLKLREPIEMDPNQDRRGPISLAAVATVRPPQPSPSPEPSPAPSPQPSPDEPAAPEGRVAAFGDVDFASNAYLGFSGNRDFFLNTVAWLAQDTDLISVRPRDAEDHRMTLTQSQAWNVWIVSLALLPGLFVVLGVGSWWRRR